MKKLLSVLGLVMLLTGCGETDLTLKEKCSKYLATAKSRAETNNSGVAPSTIRYVEGTFYSRVRQSCVTVEGFIWEVPNMQPPSGTSYVDELTGETIVVGTEFYKDSGLGYQEVDHAAFQKSLQLIK